MRTNTAEQLEWRPQPARAPQPDLEPPDLSACLAGPNGLELVVEMAHDLRSPLTSILFLAEAMQQGQGGAVTETQRRQLGLIYSAALCLCTAASDVLELARGGVRLVERDPAPFSVVEMFGSVRSMIQPLAEEHGLDVRFGYPVPERRVGHARALSRVLLNLATNAVKYTDSGFVEIAARPLTPTQLEFSVRDTGPGLDAGAIESVFQPFRKASSGLRQQFSSSGLGLAICRKLVRAMRSELHVETRPGWGTRFFFAVDAPAGTPVP
ncbi:MAG TPA: HAMP domain-containing sensor histidine kinase [Gemmatimonadales bacterium]|jgi:signal transduction histidine kinase|nr:HAMP domain-containing sensor histidine kinase [Gemmatimonadales bacterium]